MHLIVGPTCRRLSRGQRESSCHETSRLDQLDQVTGGEHHDSLVVVVAVRGRATVRLRMPHRQLRSCAYRPCHTTNRQGLRLNGVDIKKIELGGLVQALLQAPDMTKQLLFRTLSVVLVDHGGEEQTSDIWWNRLDREAAKTALIYLSHVQRHP